MFFFRHALHDFIQCFRFLRSQNCGWLIQNQDTCTSEQHFYNLNTLLLADGELLNFLFRINKQIITLTDFPDLLMDFFQIKPHNSGLTEDDIFCNCMVLYQHKMLKNHADTFFNRLPWIGEIYLFTKDSHLSFIRRKKTGDHVHQG